MVTHKELFAETATLAPAIRRGTAVAAKLPAVSRLILGLTRSCTVTYCTGCF